MASNLDRAHDLSRQVIGCGIRVHRALGPGLLESVYQRCLAHELCLAGLKFVEQRSVRIEYRGLFLEDNLRCDLLVDECLLVELKAVHEVLPVHKAQVLTYLRLLRVPLGLILNFHEERLADGIHRLILQGSDPGDDVAQNTH